MNADQLVTRVKARAFIPNTSSFTTQLILDEINTAQRGIFAEKLLKTDGEFFTETVDLTPDASGNVVFPAEALSSTARVLTWVATNGQESPPLRRIEQADIGSVSAPNYTYNSAPNSFALNPNGVRVFGYTTGSLRCRYSRRPGDLVTGDQYSVLSVTAVTPGVGFVADAPSGGDPTGNWENQTLDLMYGRSPYRRVQLDQQITAGTSVGGYHWNYTGAMVSVGDYLTHPGYSYFPNVPVEWHDLLMMYSAAAVASLRKDYALEDRRMAEAEMLYQQLKSMAQSRTKQNPKVLSAWAGRVIGSRGLT